MTAARNARKHREPIHLPDAARRTMRFFQRPTVSEPVTNKPDHTPARQVAVKPILIMAGGTGGHVYPALAVAEFLRARGVPLFWLGTERGIEARVVPAQGIALLTIKIAGLRRKGVLGWVLGPFQAVIALAQAGAIMLRIRPAAVLGMGGYVSGPGGLAAWILHIPLILHEQNAVLGLTNRLLAPLASRLLEGFPGTFLREERTEAIGNPVRASIAAVAPPDQRFAQAHTRLRLLVLGGSQGARALNETVPQAVACAGAQYFDIRHQTGAPDQADTQAAYDKLGIAARVEPFIECMDQAYAWADLAVCRAGALTLAELTAAGVAAVLVPYPHAVDDHQTVNARYLSEGGAAVLVPQPELTAERLAEILREFLANPGRLRDMAGNARRLAKPDATAQVGEICLELARG
jgi:UDP-N-acetylglucosamine--N-acetylmuramyl-(pentapeptide) pyrophosphoryl-undecaprenol N-acetylglucosamine transferase